MHIHRFSYTLFGHSGRGGITEKITSHVYYLSAITADEIHDGKKLTNWEIGMTREQSSGVICIIC